MAHQYSAELESALHEHQVPFEVRRAKGTAWIERKHQLDAVDRWFTHGWRRLDQRLRSSITEGIVVFLSLFDENPAVHRTFCPPRSAYASPPKPGEPRPLPPLEELLESGHVLALNFPVGLNPGLARALGVMLKLDFQRAVQLYMWALLIVSVEQSIQVFDTTRGARAPSAERASSVACRDDRPRTFAIFPQKGCGTRKYQGLRRELPTG
jgi:hypothetical protein